MIFHFFNLSLNFFFFAFAVACFYLYVFCFINNYSHVFFNFFFFGFLFSHLGSNNHKLLSYFLDDHLCLFNYLNLLGLNDFLFFILSLYFLNLFTCIVYLLSFCFNCSFHLFYWSFFIYYIYFKLNSDNLFSSYRIFCWLNCSTNLFNYLVHLLFFSS